MSLIARVNDNADASPSLYSVGFSHGVLKPEHAQSVTSRIYQHRDVEKMCKLVVETPHMDYTGNFDVSKRDDGKYIGVEDPDTNEITIIPLKRIRVRPAVSVAQEGSADDEIPESKPRTRQEQYDSVIEAFGGAKQKQSVMRRKKHGIDTSMIHGALDQAGVGDIEIKDVQEKVADDQGVLPPHNLQTNNPAECYPVDNYFPSNVRHDLEAFVSDINDADAETLASWRQENRYPLYIQTHLENLPLAEVKRKETAVYIKYLMFLMKLFSFRVAQLRQKDPFSYEDENSICQMPGSCLTYILDTFTEKAGRARSFPTRLKDKVFVVILLLALRIDLFRVATKDLLSDLKVGTKKLTSVAKSMGCSVKVDRKAETPEIFIELSAPLKLPTPRTPARTPKGRR